MSSLDPVSLGVVLIFLALTLFAGLWLMLKMVPRLRPNRQIPSAGLEIKGVANHDQAVMIIQAGGKISAINQPARNLFHLKENETPNLEYLLKQVRPSELFLSLCVVEGKANLHLGGHPLEAVSYQIKGNDEPVFLVTLKKTEESVAHSPATISLQEDTLQLLTRLSQETTARLDLDSILQAILKEIEKLLPADLIEIKIWDGDIERLIPYRSLALPSVDRRFEQLNEQQKPEAGFSGYLFNERKPLFVPDTQKRTDIQPSPDSSGFPVRSFVGVPLQVGRELVGTFEFSSFIKDAFPNESLEMIHLIANQVAVAIHNALLYRSEQRRNKQLTGLAQLVMTVGSAQESQGMFGRLVENIAPLVNTEIVGFLLYDDAQHAIIGQAPFHGVPSQFIEIYRTALVPGSQGERIVASQELVISQNAADDVQWKTLGLEHLAQAASLRETVLAPLTASGHMLGYLQISNHVSGSRDFSKDEIQLLTIIANQIAPIIENVTLVDQTRQRVQRAESLRQIAVLASSAAKLEEIMSFSLQELARLLNADVAAAFLVDRNRNLLQLQRSSIFGDVKPIPEFSTTLSIDDAQFPFTMTGGTRTSIFGNNPEEQPVIPFYQQIWTAWGLASMVIAPLIVRDEGIGEIWIGSHSPDFFDQSDLQVLFTAAGQLAGVVERSFLEDQTDESLRRRVDELTAMSRISHELSTSLDLDSVLQLVYDEALRTTRADCGSLVLLEVNRPAPKGPKIRVVVGEPLEAGLFSLDSGVLEKGESLLVADVTQSNLPAPHDGIASYMIVPILYQQHQAGLIVLHSRTNGQFDDASIEIAQSLATQVSVALTNALQYEQQTQQNRLLRREVETLSELFKLLREFRHDHTLDESLQLVAGAIQKATQFRAVLISTYEKGTGLLRRVVGAGLPEDVWNEFRSNPSLWTSMKQVFEPQFKVGGAYFIPADHFSIIPEDVKTFVVMEAPQTKEPDAWDPDDMLLVPIFGADQQPLGLISLDDPVNGQRPTQPVFEALDLFAMQTSLVIDSYQQTQMLNENLNSTQSQNDLLKQSMVDVQESLPLLLRKDLERTVTINQLRRQFVRVRASLQIASLASRQSSIPDILHTVAQEILNRFEFQTALLAESTPTGPHLQDVIGGIPTGANLEALFGQRNPLRQVLQDREMLLAENMELIPEWQNNPLLNALNARCYICLPLVIGVDRWVGILAVSTRPQPAFTSEDREVLTQFQNLVGIALQNSQLVSEMKRRLTELDLLLAFSRRLSGQDPEGILKNLVDSALQALPKVDAGWIALWDASLDVLTVKTATGYSDNQRILAIHFKLDESQPCISLPLRAYLNDKSTRVDDIHFSQDYVLEANDLLAYKQATGDRLPLSSLLVPIRSGETNLGILVLDNFTQSSAFTSEDELLILSLVKQAALVMENTQLIISAEQRATQLQALTQAAGTITSNLRSDALVYLLLDQLKGILPYDTATLWLRNAEALTVAATRGFVDGENRVGLSVSIEDSLLFQEMLKTEQPLSIGNVHKDLRFPAIIEAKNLSWLALPLFSKSELIGVLALEKQEAEFYSPEHIQLAITFGSQAAISLENARLFEQSESRTSELDQRSKRLALLNRFSSEVGISLDKNYILNLTAQQMMDALNGSRSAVVLLGKKGRAVLNTDVPSGDKYKLPQPLPFFPLLERLKETRGIFSSADVNSEIELTPLMKSYFEPRRTQSLLIVPLVTGTNLMGWIWVQTEKTYRFSVQEIELARTICNQAAIAIQNANLYAETRSLKEDLERRVEERTTELLREHQNTDTLLRIITELSASLDMDQVLNRTLGVLSDSLGAEQGMILLNQSSRIYQAGIPLLKPGNKPDWIEQFIADWVKHRRASALVEDFESDARWEISPDQLPLYKSVIAAPLILGEENLGTLFLFHRQKSAFNLDQVDVVEATARQISIALNNAELFKLIRDQSENLGAMLRTQQIDANRSRAILEAVADGVLVTDFEVNVMLFNASAERILRLDGERVRGKPLDKLGVVFDKSASNWFHIIRRWSEEAGSYSEGETYSEQAELDDNRIISIHLSPVIFRSTFMGTVSIFRDITQEVLVDRMKSEFIANVSHELRTPMTSIKGYVEVMLMGAAGELNDQQKRFMNIVKGNTERLGVLVNDLLDVSRIDSGRIQFLFETLKIPFIAQEVMEDVLRRSREENKNITITLDAPKNLPSIRGDRERVRQVFENLIRNSYNYTPADGQIVVRMRTVSNEVRIDVQDNGIGISFKDQPRIFERFYRGNDPLVLATAGNGLGLALSKTIIEMHQGRIWFESSGIPGTGSTFSFTLPISQLEE